MRESFAGKPHLQETELLRSVGIECTINNRHGSLPHSQDSCCRSVESNFGIRSSLSPGYTSKASQCGCRRLKLFQVMGRCGKLMADEPREEKAEDRLFHNASKVPMQKVSSSFLAAITVFLLSCLLHTCI